MDPGAFHASGVAIQRISQHFPLTLLPFVQERQSNQLFSLGTAADMERLLTTGDVASMLQMSEATIKRWADAGTLSCIRTPGGHRKFRLTTIAAFFESRERVQHDSGVQTNKKTDDLVAALLTGDSDKVAVMLAAAVVDSGSVAITADELITPAINRVWDACASGRCKDYHENVAASVLIDACARLRGTFKPQNASSTKVLIAPLPSEKTAVIAWAASMVGTASGHDVVVLDPGLPAPSIAQAAAYLSVSRIVLAGTHVAFAPAVSEYLRLALDSVAPNSTSVVWVCPSQASIEGMPDGIAYLESFSMLEALLSTPASPSC